MFYRMENCKDFLYESDKFEHREIRFLLCALDIWKKYTKICIENNIVFPNMDSIIWESVLRELGLFGKEIKSLPTVSKVISLNDLYANSQRKRDNEFYFDVSKNEKKIALVQGNSIWC